jgi:hypothetical protein
MNIPYGNHYGEQNIIFKKEMDSIDYNDKNADRIENAGSV